MSLMDIDLPEVRALPVRARFYPREEDGAPMVEISAVGSKDTSVRKVTPADMANFKSEWDAYCDGRPPVQRRGTPLTEVPGINQDTAAGLIHQNIHTMEELAALSDIQCSALGHGTLTRRKAAQGILAARRLELQERAGRLIAKPVAAQPLSEAPEIAEIKDEISELKQGMTKLVELIVAMQPKPRGRPKKNG